MSDWFQNWVIDLDVDEGLNLSIRCFLTNLATIDELIVTLRKARKELALEYRKNEHNATQTISS